MSAPLLAAGVLLGLPGIVLLAVGAYDAGRGDGVRDLASAAVLLVLAAALVALSTVAGVAGRRGRPLARHQAANTRASAPSARTA